MCGELVTVNKLVKQNFRGSNCGETVSRIIIRLLNLNYNHKISIKEVNGMQKCQALEGAKQALASASENGKTNITLKLPSLDREFEDYFGDVICEKLSGNDHHSYDHLCRCYRINTVTVKLAARWWRENIS